MQKQNKQWIKAHFLRGGFYLLLVLAGTLVALFRLEARAQERRGDRLAAWEVDANIRALPAISDATTGCIPDTWAATNTPHAPPGRQGHTTVWTGTEMIVWGGDSRNGLVSTGGRYNPIIDDWTKTSNTNPPTARDFHTAVWTGSEMIVWGDLTAAPL